MTDSNFLHYGDLYKYLVQEVLQTRMFKKKADKENFKMRVLNVLSNISTVGIMQRLWEYTGTANVAEEDRKYIKMKNEFYYTRVIVTFAKKSYVGLQKRQEEVIFKTPKLDVKGVNFFKSTASEGTSKFIYQDVLMDQLLDPPSGEVSLRNTYKVISDFQKKIRGDIANGDLRYMKRSIRVKTPDGYANPMRIGSYKAVYVWNHIVPDKERIDLPATITLIKVLLRNKQDAAKLEQWPDIYKKVIDLFDTNEEVGDYVDKETGKTKKGKGIKAIAIPSELEVIPEWLLAIIDTETLVSDNMQLFAQLYRPLGLTPGRVSVNGSSAVYYTNVIRI